MVVGAKLRCFGVRLENGKFSDPIFCKKPRSKFVWLGRTYELRNHRRRELSFEVGDFIYLKVSPMRGLHHFKV
jgi:hypothetical protein